MQRQINWDWKDLKIILNRKTTRFYSESNCLQKLFEIENSVEQNFWLYLTYYSIKVIRQITVFQIYSRISTISDSASMKLPDFRVFRILGNTEIWEL